MSHFRSGTFGLQALAWIVFLSALFVDCRRLSAGADPLQYSVVLQGIEDRDLLEDLKRSSRLLTGKLRAPFSAFFLKKQAEEDLDRLLETCYGHGYYQARATVKVQTEQDGTSQVVYTFRPGPLYQIQNVSIKFEPQQQKQAITVPDLQELNIPAGTPARAGSILQAKTALERQLLSQGYLDIKQEKPEVMVDDATHSVNLIFHVRPGHKARLGLTTLKGLQRVPEAFVRERIPWSSGMLYDPALIYRFKKTLLDTGLFSLIRVDIADQDDGQGRRPVTVTLKERTPRSVRLGIGYETDIGPQARAAWTHSNFWGRGERLSLVSDLSGLKQELDGRLNIPNFFREDQTLLMGSSFLHEAYDSYTNTAFKAETGLRRHLDADLSLNAGIGYKVQDTEDAEGSNQFHLLYFPGGLEWDTRDNLLNPSQGMTIALGVTPFQSVFPADLTYVKSLLSMRWYQSLNRDKSLILALRGRLGSISGASTASIPADERFYAGGGGSIRGFPYQEVGPQNNGDPFGGRSLIELSSELRWTIADPFGAALFLDGGQVRKDSLPDSGGDLAWGAGFGLRYFTELGPLRLDLGFPLNPDDHIDDAFQVYISIGQAF